MDELDPPPVVLAEQVRQLQQQVRNQKRIVIVLIVLVVWLALSGGNLKKMFESVAAFALIGGALLIVPVFIFGGARLLEKRFPPQ